MILPQSPFDTRAFQGPYRASGNYVAGSDEIGLPVQLGKVFTSEDLPPETIAATARLWAASWAMLEALSKAEELDRLMATYIENPDDLTYSKWVEISQAQTQAKETRLAALSLALEDFE